MLRVSFGSPGALVIPFVFVGLAAADDWSIDAALRAASIAPVAALVAIGYVAVRRVRLPGRGWSCSSRSSCSASRSLGSSFSLTVDDTARNASRRFEDARVKRDHCFRPRDRSRQNPRPLRAHPWLRFVEQNDFACVFDANGTMLRITAVSEVAHPGYTVLGWQVADIEAAVEALTLKGVKFTQYDGMDQDLKGIWTTPGGDKVAWLTDPDGNNVSLTQFV
jgi:hypothetical protein